MRELTPERAEVRMLALAAVGAIGIGVLAAATSPLVPLGALIGLAILVAIWLRPWLGVVLFVAIIATLPFGVIPLPLAGAQMTFVDATLIATYSAFAARVVFGGQRLKLGQVGLALVAFVVVSVLAFVAGSSSDSATPELIRRFGKLLASVLFFVLVRGLIDSRERLIGLLRGLIVAGAVQGAIGAGLMALSPLSQLTILTRLQAIGYPTADVLRYVPGPNDTYTDQLRAIGTSVDPNVFGGTVMLALAVIVVQWASPRPVWPRWVLVLLALPAAAGVLLSLSRASWLGLAVGLGLIGLLCYRRILVIGAVGLLAVLLSPPGEDFVVRFVSGFSTADRATAFRVGEYANALTLLQRYPILGIGFGQSPDIDVTAGVSSVYLLVAEQTGFLGLGLFLLAVLLVWFAGLRGLRHMPDEQLQGIRAALLAALTAALVAGVLDHYFANQAFPHAVALFWLYAAGLVASVDLAGAGARQREPERATKARTAAFGAHRAPV
jgi:O-antigen ligase